MAASDYVLCSKCSCKLVYNPTSLEVAYCGKCWVELESYLAEANAALAVAKTEIIRLRTEEMNFGELLLITQAVKFQDGGWRLPWFKADGSHEMIEAFACIEKRKKAAVESAALQSRLDRAVELAANFPACQDGCGCGGAIAGGIVDLSSAPSAKATGSEHD